MIHEPPPHNRDYDRDPKLRPFTGGFANQGSTLEAPEAIAAIARRRLRLGWFVLLRPDLGCIFWFRGFRV